MKQILLIGGTGFVGTAVASRLASVACGVPALHSRPAAQAQGDAMRIPCFAAEFADLRLVLPTRWPERSKHLALLPGAEIVAADVHDDATLRRLMTGTDAVISLVGLLHSREGTPWGADFERAHVALPRRIAAIAAERGVRRIVHVSALGAAADAPSGYLRSKAAGEAALFASDLDVTVVQPSVIFGRDDAFLNLFAALARLAPVLPLAGAQTRFAPVWVEDVAATMVDCLRRPESSGQRYPLCGPRQYRLRELAAWAAAQVGARPLILPLPEPLAWLQALLMERLPNAPLSRDNLRSLRLDSVCPAGCELPFGRRATALETVAPLWLRAA